MKRVVTALMGILALLGVFTIAGSSPASASPPNTFCESGWTCVSNGGWSGYVAVPGPDKWREVAWVVEYKYTSAHDYLIRAFVQDTVDSDEPDANGYIQANWASPGNMVWHTMWPDSCNPGGPDNYGPIRDTNSADWNDVKSPAICANDITDGAPSAWHVQFNITAKGTSGGFYTHNEVYAW